MAVNDTKATRSTLKLSFLNLDITYGMQLKLNQRYLLKKVLFSDIISFDQCIFHKSGIMSADISSFKSWFYVWHVVET